MSGKLQFVLSANAKIEKTAKKKKTRIKIDKENYALYLRLDESAIVESEEAQP